MKIVIVGCGRMGAELARRLFQRGHEISVIDGDKSSFSHLAADFEGRINEGEAINRDVLHRAGIERADAVAVVTDSDVLNAVVAHLARTYYNIPNVVVRNTDPRYRQIHETYGLQVISALSWGAQRIEEMLYHSDIRAVFSAGNGEVEIYEVAIPDGWSGRSVSDLIPSGSGVPVSVTRAGRAILPTSDFHLEAGDVIHISATLEGMEALRERMSLTR
ncbi:MAG: TrkA family potassium uptake protein [Anaerolineaceae bacterium]|nr:TrkA family potassium uptake protein [Anaerolineaceae bacterium]